MKSYTDLEQSRKLAEILPPESADYCWGIDDETLHYNSSPYPCAWKDYTCKEYYIPCWSLAALLKLMPNFNMFKRTIECKIETINHSIDKACDLVDAAFEMVCWLKENNEL